MQVPKPKMKLNSDELIPGKYVGASLNCSWLSFRHIISKLLETKLVLVHESILVLSFIFL